MKINWGFGIVAAYVVFASSMVIFAIKVSQYSNDLVSEDYYEDAVKFQDRIDAGTNALDSNTLIEANYLKENGSIELFAYDTLLSTSGKIVFYKPDDSKKDFTLDFKLDEGKKAVYPLKSMPTGEWKMNISWTIGHKNYYLEKRVSVN